MLAGDACIKLFIYTRVGLPSLFTFGDDDDDCGYLCVRKLLCNDDDDDLYVCVCVSIKNMHGLFVLLIMEKCVRNKVCIEKVSVRIDDHFESYTNKRGTNKSKFVRSAFVSVCSKYCLYDE